MVASRSRTARRFGFAAVALLAVVSLSGCDWAQLGYGPEHTGNSQDTSITKEYVQTGSLQLDWTASTGGVVTSSPAVFDGVAFVGSKDGRLYAYDAAGSVGCSGTPKSCAPLWRSVDLGAPAWSSPAVAGGLVYAASNATLFAFDRDGASGCAGTPKTCTPIWSVPLTGAAVSSPTVANGRVSIVSTDGSSDTLASLDSASGALQWSATVVTNAGVADRAEASPTVANGTVYATFPAGGPGGPGVAQPRVLAFDAAGVNGCSGAPTTCQPLWATDTGDGAGVTGTPAVAGNTLYVAGRAFDARGATGCAGAPKVCQPLWSMAGGGRDTAVTSNIVYSGGAVFDRGGVTGCSGTPKVCEPLWTLATDGAAVSKLSIANGLVYAGTSDPSGSNAGKLLTFDAGGVTNCSGAPKECLPLWTGLTGAATAGLPLPPARSAPAVSEGRVYIGSLDGKLYAFGLEKAPPTTSVMAPHRGDPLSGTTTLSASVGDNVGVRKVEFRLTGGGLNDGLLGVATAGPSGWLFNWDTRSLPDGAYTLTSVAFDIVGNQGRSAAVPFTLQNGPSSDTPATVTADALPTVQVTGIVWAQVLVGNTVYATGSFTKARPAGAAAGVSEVTRNNLLAFDITTGQLLPFNHSLNGEGRAIVASPDGSRIYVGGSFTTVDGASHARLAAFDPADGSLVPSFEGGVTSTVRTLAATNETVYAGGGFLSASSGDARGRLVAYARTGALLDWKPSANLTVAAMVMSPDQTKVIFGGSFNTVNGASYHGLAAADAATGAPLPYASQSDSYPILEDGVNSGVTGLSANGSTVFLTGFNFQNIAKPGGLEGRAAINPADGSVIWISDCHGDSYSAVPIGGVLYSTSHAHDCEPAGYFPDTTPRVWHRALVETIAPTHLSGPATGGYWGYEGVPTPSQLVWYPNVNTGTFSGQSQGGWSIVGNSSYIAMGGEFTKINGKNQQALVRFAIRSLAPNLVGPEAYPSPGVSATAASSSGTAPVVVHTTWDRDDAVLTYRLYRDGGATPIFTTTADTRFWRLPDVTYSDTGLVAGSTHTYRLVVTDPSGNSTATTSTANPT